MGGFAGSFLPPKMLGAGFGASTRGTFAGRGFPILFAGVAELGAGVCIVGVAVRGGTFMGNGGLVTDTGIPARFG